MGNPRIWWSTCDAPHPFTPVPHLCTDRELLTFPVAWVAKYTHRQSARYCLPSSARLKKYPFTFFSGVNTLFNALLNAPAFASVDFSKLKVTLGGGMAVQASVAERWQKVTGKVITQAWGLTETSPAGCINRVEDAFNGSVGLPIPSTEISIRDDSGAELAINQVGEICLRGPQVMRGYWNRPDETAKVMLPGGWLRTGDVGRMDETWSRIHRGSEEGHDPGIRVQRVSQRGRSSRGSSPRSS